MRDTLRDTMLEAHRIFLQQFQLPSGLVNGGTGPNASEVGTNVATLFFVMRDGYPDVQAMFHHKTSSDGTNIPAIYSLEESGPELCHEGPAADRDSLLEAARAALERAESSWFDNVAIHDPSVQTAYFDVSGNATTPVGGYYDAELVFAGEANQESAYFTQLNATLGLFYQNETNRFLSSFPTYYSFSGDTGEAADNLVATYANGIVNVAQGANPNYVYLGSASLALDPNSMTLSPSTTSQRTTTTTSLASTSSSLTAGSSQSVSTSTTSTTSATLTTGLSSETASSSRSSAVTAGYLPTTTGVAILVVVIVAAVVIALKHRRPIPPAPI